MSRCWGKCGQIQDDSLGGRPSDVLGHSSGYRTSWGDLVLVCVIIITNTYFRGISRHWFSFSSQKSQEGGILIHECYMYFMRAWGGSGRLWPVQGYTTDKEHWTYIQFSWLQIGCSFNETNYLRLFKGVPWPSQACSTPAELKYRQSTKYKVQSLGGLWNVRTAFCLPFPSQASQLSLGVNACHQCGVISLWGPHLSQWTSDFLLRCCVWFTNSLIFCKMHEHFLIEKQFRNAEHIIVMK